MVLAQYLWGGLPGHAGVGFGRLQPLENDWNAHLTHIAGGCLAWCKTLFVVLQLRANLSFLLPQ